MVWDLIDNMLADPALLDAAIGAHVMKERELAPVLDDRMKRHQACLEKAEKALATARHLRYTGEIDTEALKQDREHYEREIDMLSWELARMRGAAEDRKRKLAIAKEMRDISLQWATIRE